MSRFFTHRGFLFFIGSCIGFGISFIVPHFKSSDTAALFTEQRELSSKYHLINPLLACGDDNFSHLSNQSVITLEQKARTLLAEQKNSGSLSDGAVYFRELNGGPWFGINEDTLFVPGSLLKVPLIMSIYAKAEDDPSVLNNKILFEGGAAPATEHYTSAEIKMGKMYSVEDLVKAVLIHSDNNAALLLVQLISQGELDASYEHLGIQIPKLGQDYTMAVRTYASFFRILFNATYLNREHSEQLLNFLSQATFDKGIVAGVPQGITVAHKFGERAYGEGSAVQLHDCGIVYKPTQPYLLCVMMRGNDFDVLAKNIQEVSKLVYSYAE